MKRIQSLHRMIRCAVLIAVAAPVVAQDKIPWITDLRQARDTAERQNRLVLLHFWGDLDKAAFQGTEGYGEGIILGVNTLLGTRSS